jgi:hypothetical protein
LSDRVAKSNLTIVHDVNALHTPGKQGACHLAPQCSTPCMQGTDVPKH